MGAREVVNFPGFVSKLPNGVCSGRILSGFVIDIGEARKRLRAKKLEPPTVVKRLAQAEEWQRQLDAGEVKHRAEISRRQGVSRARVTQIMHLLELHPEIRSFIHGLGSDVPPRYVTSRRLLPLCSLSWEEQLSEALRRFPTFCPRRVATSHKPRGSVQ